jgi:hypothetical protein
MDENPKALKYLGLADILKTVYDLFIHLLNTFVKHLPCIKTAL